MPTRAGVFQAEIHNGTVSALWFPRGSRRKAIRPAPAVRRLARELNEYFDGKRTRFSVPVSISAGTAFQQRVWRALQQIGYGRTRTYGQVARDVEVPHAARAVGGACGRNPIPILIPCHRVVAHGRKLGGFSAGLAWKSRLLELERKSALGNRT